MSISAKTIKRFTFIKSLSVSKKILFNTFSTIKPLKGEIFQFYVAVKFSGILALPLNFFF